MKMSAVCSLNMHLRGAANDIELFVKAMKQDGPVWMGRGADVCFDDEYNDTTRTRTISGSTKNSIEASLVDDALSMQKQKETGDGYWYFGKTEIADIEEFITIWEAAKRYHIDFEVYSYVWDYQLVNHILYVAGEIVVDDSTSYDEDDDGEMIDGFDEHFEFQYKFKIKEGEKDMRLTVKQAKEMVKQNEKKDLCLKIASTYDTIVV